MEVLHYFAPCLAFRAGMLCISAFMALFVCGTIYFVVKYARPRGAPRRSSLASCLVLLLFPLMVGAGLQLLFLWTTTEGVGVTAQVANQSLLWFKLPVTAQDVTFHHSLAAGDEAEFSISETDFVQWTQEMHWETHVFQRDPDWPMPQELSKSVVPPEMKFGFFFHHCWTPDCRDRISGYFNHDTGRAKVWLWMD